MKKSFKECGDYADEILNPVIENLLSYNEVIYKLRILEEKCLSGLFRWVDKHKVFQLMSNEFIMELVINIKKINPNIILEVGAGRGEMGWYLSKFLSPYIMVDDYSLKCSLEFSKYGDNIINIDYKDALKKFNPDLVIASWIPYGENWTKDFRDIDSVNGYIIIGEGEGGATGSDEDWKTDWIRIDWDSVSKYGIARTDYGYRYNDIYSHTSVTYFKRPI